MPDLYSPKYGDIDPIYQNRMVPVDALSIKLGKECYEGALLKLEYDGVPCYFVEQDYLFNRKGIYGFEDDAARFAFFSSYVLEILPAWISIRKSCTAMTGIRVRSAFY